MASPPPSPFWPNRVGSILADHHFPDARLVYNDGGMARAGEREAVVGISDAHPWLNDWPVDGRTHDASLFARELQPMSAWPSIIDAASSAP